MKRKFILAGLVAFLLVWGIAGIVYAIPVNLAWDPITTNSDGSPITDLAGYYVYYGDTAGGPYPNVRDAGLATSFTLDMLGAVEGATYYFVFTGYDLAGNESPGYSNEISKIVVIVQPPDPPTNPGTGPVGLTWVAPTTNEDGTPLTDLGGYMVYWGDVRGGPYPNVRDVGNVTSVLWADLGIDPAAIPEGVTLYFVVTAYDTAVPNNESINSNEAAGVLNPTNLPAVGTGLRFP